MEKISTRIFATKKIPFIPKAKEKDITIIAGPTIVITGIIIIIIVIIIGRTIIIPRAPHPAIGAAGVLLTTRERAHMIPN
jgi:hypothetical protein